MSLGYPGRVVIGFHGCSREIAEKVLAGEEKLRPSENDFDWLGSGVYFWEFNFKRALQWASKSRKGGEPYVIGAYIELKNCLDLISSDKLDELQAAYQTLKTAYQKKGMPLPQNRRRIKSTYIIRELDCQVIEAYKEISKNKGHEILSVRGVFWEGGHLYPGSSFRKQNHIQIAVNEKCVLGYFRPIELTAIRANRARP